MKQFGFDFILIFFTAYFRCSSASSLVIGCDLRSGSGHATEKEERRRGRAEPQPVRDVEGVWLRGWGGRPAVLLPIRRPGEPNRQVRIAAPVFEFDHIDYKFQLKCC